MVVASGNRSKNRGKVILLSKDSQAVFKVAKVFDKGGVLSVRDSLEHTLRVFAASVTKAPKRTTAEAASEWQNVQNFYSGANTTRPSGC